MCSLLLFLGEPFNYCAILDDYKMHEKIGEGGFGYVHLATNRETNKQYAIKYMDMTQTRKYLAKLALPWQLKSIMPKKTTIIEVVTNIACHHAAKLLIVTQN